MLDIWNSLDFLPGYLTIYIEIQNFNCYCGTVPQNPRWLDTAPKARYEK